MTANIVSQKTPLRDAIESALVALLAAACCLWILISTTTGVDPSTATIVLFAVGVGAGVIAHFVFMVRVLKHAGSRVLPWMVAVVLVFPLGTAAWFATHAAKQSK